jgi:hypothetical protein
MKLAQRQLEVRRGAAAAAWATWMLLLFAALAALSRRGGGYRVVPVVGSWLHVASGD